MSSVMMSYGYFQFSIATAAYQNFTKSKEWMWASQPQIGGNDASQYSGFNQTIEMSGVIYPHYRGGFRQLKELERIGDQAIPQVLMDGRGYYHGLFIMTKLNESQVIIGAQGQPKKQEFTIGLKRHDNTQLSVLSFFGG